MFFILTNVNGKEFRLNAGSIEFYAQDKDDSSQTFIKMSSGEKYFVKEPVEHIQLLFTETGIFTKQIKNKFYQEES